MKRILQSLKTTTDYSALILRITLGLILWPHGAQLLLGWFGGNGYTGTMSYFTDVMGLPYIVGLSVIALQFFGAIFILTGTFTRVIALGIFGLFVGMIFTAHLEYGFFMNWFGNQAGEGYEYHLLVLGIAAALVVRGGGAWSTDVWMTRNV